MFVLAILSLSAVHATYIIETATVNRPQTAPPPYLPPPPPPPPPPPSPQPQAQPQPQPQQQQRELEVKWDHFGKVRRFTISYENCCVFESLMKALHVHEPAFEGKLAWRDNEDDLVLLNSSNELTLALKYKKDGFLRLQTIDDKFNQSKAAEKPKVHHIIHPEDLVGKLIGGKEIDIEVDVKLSSEEGELESSTGHTKGHKVRPIFVIRHCKNDTEKKEHSDEKEKAEKTVKTTTTTTETTTASVTTTVPATTTVESKESK